MRWDIIQRTLAGHDAGEGRAADLLKSFISRRRAGVDMAGFVSVIYSFIYQRRALSCYVRNCKLISVITVVLLATSMFVCVRLWPRCYAVQIRPALPESQSQSQSEVGGRRASSHLPSPTTTPSPAETADLQQQCGVSELKLSCAWRMKGRTR